MPNKRAPIAVHSSITTKETRMPLDREYPRSKILRFHPTAAGHNYGPGYTFRTASCRLLTCSLS